MRLKVSVPFVTGAINERVGVFAPLNGMNVPAVCVHKYPVMIVSGTVA